MQMKVEGQEGVRPATVQPAEDRVQKRPAAIESMRLRQACDPRDQVSKPLHDLWAAVAGMIESTDVPDVWLSACFELWDQFEHRLVDSVDMVDGHECRPTPHHRRHPGQCRNWPTAPQDRFGSRRDQFLDRPRCGPELPLVRSERATTVTGPEEHPGYHVFEQGWCRVVHRPARSRKPQFGWGGIRRSGGIIAKTAVSAKRNAGSHAFAGGSRTCGSSAALGPSNCQDAARCAGGLVRPLQFAA